MVVQAVAFHGKLVQFRPLRALAPGEELTIQYTDLYLPRGLRRARLGSSHGFHCMCERCCDEQALAVRLAPFERSCASVLIMWCGI